MGVLLGVALALTSCAAPRPATTAAPSVATGASAAQSAPAAALAAAADQTAGAEDPGPEATGSVTAPVEPVVAPGPVLASVVGPPPPPPPPVSVQAPAEGPAREGGGISRSRPEAPAPAASSGGATVPAPVPAAAPAPSSGGYASELLWGVNAKRRDAGLAPLAASSCAGGYAGRWAEHLSSSGGFSHQDLGPVLSGCDARSAAENIARTGGSAASMVAMWMDSPVHRANILDPELTHVGTGAVQRDGSLTGVQVFLRL